MEEMTKQANTLKQEIEELKKQLANSERTVADLEKQLGVKDNMIKSMKDRVAEATAAAEKAQADFH